MAVSFDDLIPTTRLSFDDLTPSFGERLQTPTAPLVPSHTPDQFSILPMRKTGPNPGQWEWDYSAGVLGSLLRSLTSPGDVWRGTVPTPYAPGASPEASPDVISRATETASVISPVSPSYRAGARYGTVQRPSVPLPPTKDILETGSQGYNAARGSGWEVPSQAVGDVARSAESGLTTFSPQKAPGTFADLASMQDPKRSFSSVADIMDYRDALTATMRTGSESDAKAARIARGAVDDLLNNLGAAGARPAPGITPTMPVEAIGPTIETARANTRAARAANRVSGDLDPATKGILAQIELGQGVSGRGYNVDFQLRNRAAAILKRNEDVASLLPSEKLALEDVAMGNAPRNLLRDFGRTFAPTDAFHFGVSGGLGGTTGFAVGGPVGAAVGAWGLPIAGAIAKGAGTGATRRALTAAEELMRSNSPMAQEIIASLLNRPPPVGREAAVIHSLFPGLLAPPPDPRQERRLPPGFI